jgi:hybrid polyketide synthase/nonribosomal peptide synthetase ACE1
MPPVNAMVAADNLDVFAPFVFSAASKASLISYLTAFCDYLRGTDDTLLNFRDLAHTLYSRRSRFPFSTTIAASNTTDICAKLEAKLKIARIGGEPEFGVRPLLQSSETRKPLILGIFTGQGAQWAQMGAELIAKSLTARRVIESLELRLSRLPLGDRPSWSLLEEIQKESAFSRIGQATFSQPICTAIQILQVNMLYAAGVKFSAVVGHSSGEIGAAYAAGFISAEDAICIAYYRGLYSADLAKGRNGQSGAMMAVESTVEDIQGLCGSRHFKGRVGIAAINSPASLTVSGDSDAVNRLQMVLQDEKKFARILKVDKAYHSHHMLPCSEKYLDALSVLGIQVRPGAKCPWFSSVYEGEVGTHENENLQDRYWINNLTKPVLFMQAVQSAWTNEGPFDLAIEVGPHPALKGPVLETIQSLSAHPIPYTGLLHRDRNSIEAFADGLGLIWSRLGKGYVDFQTYDTFLSGTNAPPFKLIKGLPTYAWDHETEFWHESRYIRAQRLRPDSIHQLLGHITPDSTEQVTRWRNILRPNDIPWIKCHRLQGQTVFPAAGYVVLALEAALWICKSASVSLAEVLDLEIGKALTFDQDDMNVEAVFSLSNIVKSSKRVSADFTYNAAEKNSDSLVLLARGSVRVYLGEQSAAALPTRSPRLPNLLQVQSKDFYESLENMDYQYSGPFKALTDLERRLGYCTGLISNLEKTDLIVHPAILDAAFQSIFLAHSAPFDGGIWALHVPKTIRSVRINPVLFASEIAKGTTFPFDAVQPVEQSGFVGDVNIYRNSLEYAMIQVQGLIVCDFQLSFSASPSL